MISAGIIKPGKNVLSVSYKVSPYVNLFVYCCLFITIRSEKQLLFTTKTVHKVTLLFRYGCLSVASGHDQT